MTSKTLIHYCEDQEQKRIRYKSPSNFNASALCGNKKSIHLLKHTRVVDKVTCTSCKARINGQPYHYPI